MFNSFLSKNPEKRNKTIAVLSKYGTIILMILYFLLLFNHNQNNDQGLRERNMVLYVIALIVPMVVFAYFILSTVEDKKYLGLVILMILIVTLTLLAHLLPDFNKFLQNFVNYFIDYAELPPLSSTSSYLITIFAKILLIGIIVIGLSIVLNIFFNEATRRTGKMGIFWYSIFLIPCLINDYVRSLFRDVASTPLVVFVLLIVETLLILAYIFLPTLIGKLVETNSKKILYNPTTFYFEKVIDDSSFLLPDKKRNKFPLDGSMKNEHSTPVYNYYISTWISTNQPTYGANQEKMMFRYGDGANPTVGCPYIACKGNGKWKIVVTNSTCDEGTLEVSVPMQRWNHLVFNYHDLQVDLFVNGQLYSTIPLGKKCVPTYNNGMNFSIGQEDSSLHGAICNVSIGHGNLNATQIAQIYNLLKLKNPPVNNLI